VDLLSAAAISVDKDLGDAEEIDALTLELTGLGDFKLPESHRQHVTSQKEGTAVLELRRDFRTGKKEPLTEAQRAEHLKPTPTVQSDHPKLAEKAKEVVGDAAGPLAKAKRLEKWVHGYVRKTYGANANTALAVLENAAGDCTEHTLLFVTVARAAGVPAREVGGVAFVNARGRPLFGWHAWAEIHDGEQWVSVDPTWGEFYVDATHIKFSEGSQDGAWMNVLGRVKVKVEKVTRRKE
jgi:transglutaminase-like putative cysteine protease